MVKQNTKVMMVAAGAALNANYIYNSIVQENRKEWFEEMLRKKPLGSALFVGGITLLAAPKIMKMLK